MATKPKCPDCGAATKTLYERKGPQGKNGLSASGNYKCPKCGRVFDSSGSVV